MLFIEDGQDIISVIARQGQINGRVSNSFNCYTNNAIIYSAPLVFDEEIIVGGIKITPVIAGQTDCVLLCGGKLDSDEIYLGSTNNYHNDGLCGDMQIFAHIESELIDGSYRSILHIRMV